MVRWLLQLLLFVVLGAGLGYGTADYAMQRGFAAITLSNGPWVIWPAEGSPTADPYTRAHFAAGGYLPVAVFEAITYRAETDSDGEPLRQDCEYVVHGTLPPARWWAIAAYSRDLQVIANEAERYSFNSYNVLRQGDGTVTIRIAAAARPGNWLPVDGSGDAFSLTLKLFNPDHTVRSRYATVPLPEITRLQCQ